MEKLKAQDLRIGNIIDAYIEPQVSEWIQIKVGVETLGLMESKPESHGFRPIPLTEKWLEDFGFEMDTQFMTERHPYYDWVKDDFRISMPYFELYCCDDIEVEFKFVHHLQNTFCDLKGYELTIKNETDEN